MDIDSGEILIDGQDIAKVSQHSLRRHISYVPQEPQMLHRTIAENICYGMDDLAGPDMDLVRRVGRAAHVEEFVSRLPDGYDTIVGERGLKLSGGQRQRVAIAQAMAKAAPILILDEATSALDSESEALVQEALWRLMDGVTAIVVAHRLATIARLDRIVVIEDGRIVEDGCHAELFSAAPASTAGCGSASREASWRREPRPGLRDVPVAGPGTPRHRLRGRSVGHVEPRRPGDRELTH